MLTYTGSRNLFGNLTNNDAAANLTLGDTLINESIRELITLRQWDFRETTSTLSTVASQQAYQLPADVGKLLNLYVTVSSTRYNPTQVTSRDQWDRINSNTSVTSDIPEFFFIFNNKVEFYPTPASSTSNAITFVYERIFRDLSVADYTTGTITTATAASTAIVGDSTVWTAQMVGRVFRITHTDTANTGDGRWYKIASRSSNTAIVLTEPYIGTSISGGSAAYTIGDASIIPEAHQRIPVYRAAEIYFTSIQPQPRRADMYKALYGEGIKAMIIDQGSKDASPRISLRRHRMHNPNFFIRDLS